MQGLSGLALSKLQAAGRLSGLSGLSGLGATDHSELTAGLSTVLPSAAPSDGGDQLAGLGSSATGEPFCCELTGHKWAAK